MGSSSQSNGIQVWLKLRSSIKEYISLSVCAEGCLCMYSCGCVLETDMECLLLSLCLVFWDRVTPWTWNSSFNEADWLMVFRDWHPVSNVCPVLRLQMCTAIPGSWVGAKNSNLGLHAYMASTWLVEPYPQPLGECASFPVYITSPSLHPSEQSSDPLVLYYPDVCLSCKLWASSKTHRQNLSGIKWGNSVLTPREHIEPPS